MWSLIPMFFWPLAGCWVCDNAARALEDVVPCCEVTLLPHAGWEVATCASTSEA